MILETNPTLIDLIIQHIVQFLSEKDLKACRLVCYKWFFPSTKALQKAANPIIFGDLYKVNLIRLRPDLETIKLFMASMTLSEDIFPYTKFEIRPSIFSPNCLPLLEQFLNQFGPAIEYLTINLAYESSDTFFKRCFPHINLCNLKSLDFCNTISGEMRPSLRTDLLTTRFNLLESFLIAAPNLENLSFWTDSENVAWPGEAIQVLSKVDLPKLRNLKISFPMTNYQLASLSKLNVKLTTFNFLIREPIFNTGSFLNIMESQKNSLENLKLVDLQCDQIKLVELPLMPHLRKIEIEGAFYGDNCKLSLFNFSFKKIPKIQTLILRNCHKQNFDLDSLLTPPYQNVGDLSYFSLLQELHVTLAHDFVNEKWLQRMPQLFPQLKNLHIMFSAEAKDLLTSVFQHLTSLEYLTINVRKCGENLDTVLTGIQTKILWDNALLPEISSRFDRMEFAHLKTKTGLRNLKSLKYLELKGEHRNYKAETRAITEVSAFLAFLQLDNLRNLVLNQTGLKLSEECLQRMKRKMHVVQIKVAGE